MDPAQTGGTPPAAKKPRKDKGLKREKMFAVTYMAKDEGGFEHQAWLRGDKLDTLLETALGNVAAGQEVEVWQRVGKPRKAKMVLA